MPGLRAMSLIQKRMFQELYRWDGTDEPMQLGRTKS